jgi:hypothetical protein
MARRIDAQSATHRFAHRNVSTRTSQRIDTHIAMYRFAQSQRIARKCIIFFAQYVFFVCFLLSNDSPTASVTIRK